MLTPADAGVLLASVGLGLIFVEFNRPGRILPGALGLLLTLLGVGRIGHLGVRPPVTLLLLACTAIPVLNARRRMPAGTLLAATLAFVVGVRFVVRPGKAAPVHMWVAIVSGGTLGLLSATLTRIAYRARRAKALD